MTPVLRILHVVPTYAPAWRYGGPIHAVHGLCRGLAAIGHEVAAYTTSVDGPDDLDVPLATAVERDGVQVSYFKSSMLRRTYWSPSLGRALRRDVPSVDVVHGHSVFLWPTWRAARAARAGARPLVLSPRGMLVPELIAAKSSWLKRCWISAIERGNLRGAAAIHVTSTVEARDLDRSGLALAPVRCVPNGVDVPAAPTGDVAREPRQVLFIGRVSWKKGIDRLIRALAHVPGAELLVAGNDDESLRPDLERLARDCGVGGRVRFLGQVGAAARDALLARASVLVLPSLSENFGNVIVEAMAAGCPVVVTPEVGAADLVTECGGGIVSDGNPEALAAAIGSILDAPDAARAMGARAREFVRANLSWPSVARRMTQVYEEAIERFEGASRRAG